MLHCHYIDDVLHLYRRNMNFTALTAAYSTAVYTAVQLYVYTNTMHEIEKLLAGTVEPCSVITGPIA